MNRLQQQQQQQQELSADRPVAKRLIDFTGWLVIFTSMGRYFFYDTIERKSAWIPPPNLMEYLMSMEEARRLALFDPYAEYNLECDEEEAYTTSQPQVDALLTDNDAEKPDESLHPVALEPAMLDGKGLPLQSVPAKHRWSSTEEHHQAIEEFEQLLRTTDFDPFLSWINICNLFSSDPRFQAIPTDKERKSIFDRLCGELAERARAKRKQAFEHAQQKWQQVLYGLTLSTAPPTWTQFSQQVKKEPWYKLLDAKQLEKDYRSYLKYLQSRSIVYQIPK